MNKTNFGDYLNKSKSRKIYKIFDQNLKREFSYWQFRKLFKSYTRQSDVHELKVCTQNDDTMEQIWIDKANQFGVAVTWKDNSIIGFVMRPLINYDAIKNETTLKYAVPTTDCYEVFWGGDNELYNYHYLYPHQRYAIDLVIKENHKTYKNQGKVNTDYFCFGKDIIAPANGTVEKVVNEGQNVKYGDFLGKVGNSGNSTEPHIHFQVMNDKNIEACTSLKIRFLNNLELIKGDVVCGLQDE
ncbi:TPA: M23 family metallopeptidase [Staphylococcus aureus]|nr:M23 family metallopeptidase [Staphylococcus aureus]